jgi:hypothetical protein
VVSRQTGERRPRRGWRFREANEKIAETASLLLELEDSIPFLCECSDERCIEIVRLSGEQYAEVSSNPRWFLHNPRHDPSANRTERLVAVREGYLIMERIGHPAEVDEAEATSE